MQKSGDGKENWMTGNGTGSSAHAYLYFQLLNHVNELAV